MSQKSAELLHPGAYRRTHADEVRIYEISPWAVPVPANLPVKAVAEQAEQLIDNGAQDAPIALLPDHTASPDDWPQIQAARELGWTAILVTY